MLIANKPKIHHVAEDSKRLGQTKYLRPLLKLIQDGKIDPSFVISHRLTLGDAPIGYETFRNNQNEGTKVVLKPEWN